MKKYIFIGIGGFFGAISRYFIKNIHLYNYGGAVPVNTLIINVTGSFVLGLLLTLFFEIWETDDAVRLGITTGFLGTYTTFSTLCKDTVGLMSNGDYYSAISYITMSAVLGLIAVFLGIVIAWEVIAKIVKGKPDSDAAE